MIATLTGRVQLIYSDRIVLDLGGVGYEVFLSTDGIAKLPEKGQQIFLFIHTLVREDALMLYGFHEEEEKELFLLLKTVSGIGPRLALTVLSGMKIAEICQAVVDEDFKKLTLIPGIGKRTAERICVELKDKVGGFVSDRHVVGKVPSISIRSSTVVDALSALSNLGYSDPIARNALNLVKQQVGEEPFLQLRVEEMIREALKALA